MLRSVRTVNCSCVHCCILVVDKTFDIEEKSPMVSHSIASIGISYGHSRYHFFILTRIHINTENVSKLFILYKVNKLKINASYRSCQAKCLPVEVRPL